MSGGGVGVAKEVVVTDVVKRELVDDVDAVSRRRRRKAASSAAPSMWLDVKGEPTDEEHVPKAWNLGARPKKRPRMAVVKRADGAFELAEPVP